MGLTGSVLRKKQFLSFEETKETSIKILSSLGYKIKPWNEDLKGKDYCSISVQKNADSWFIMYIYRKDNLADEYNFSHISSDLTRAIDIEDISEVEDMVLNFLKEYFKYYPNDYFDNEYDWYYTKDDIDSAFRNNNYHNWCYESTKNI